MKNEITHHAMHDKLLMLALGGFQTKSGWDYAIPQQWFDDLMKMGIEDPGSWFAADCTGVFPKLHHIGEALHKLLVERSDEYADKIVDYNNLAHAKGQGSAEYHFMDIMHNHAGNVACNECDAGFTNFQLLIDFFTEGWARGRKELLEEMKLKPNIMPMVD